MVGSEEQSNQADPKLQSDPASDRRILDEHADSDISAREARRSLYELMREDASFERKATEALELGRRYLGADNAHLTRIDGDTDHWEIIATTDSAEGQFPPGLELDLETTYCRKTIAAETPVSLHDAEEQGWEDDPAVEAHQLSCYHGTTVALDGEPYGTVCFVADDPRAEPFGDDETMFAELITHQLERELETERFEADLTRRNNLVNVLNRVLRHNIRNDMTVIRGRMQLITDDVDDRGSAEAAFRKIDELLEMCGKARELKDVMRQDRERQRTDVLDVVERVVESVRREFPAASFTIEGDAEVMADLSPSFERAVREVVENAAKHAGAAPTVTVTVENAPNAAAVRVADDGPGLSEQEQNVLRTGEETPLVHGSGLGLWLVHWLVTSHDGDIETVVDDGETTMTITVPRSAEPEDEQVTELRKARDLYQAAFDGATDGMLIVDDETRIVDANPEAGTVYGRTREELLGQPLRDVSSDDFDFESAWTTLQETGRDRNTSVVVGGDGKERPVEYAATADIVPGHHLVVIRGIAERRDRRQELRRTTRQLEAVVESSPNPMIAVDDTRQVQLWNGAAEDVFGYDAEEVIGEPILALNLRSMDQNSVFADRLERAFDGEVFTGLEVTRQTREGEPLDLRVSTAPIRGETGEITGVIATCEDVTAERSGSD
ncbi:MAG: PAS domain-containing protein [Halolamina sp.]